MFKLMYLPSELQQMHHGYVPNATNTVFKHTSAEYSSSKQLAYAAESKLLSCDAMHSHHSLVSEQPPAVIIAHCFSPAFFNLLPDHLVGLDTIFSLLLCSRHVDPPEPGRRAMPLKAVTVLAELIGKRRRTGLFEYVISPVAGIRAHHLLPVWS